MIQTPPSNTAARRRLLAAAALAALALFAPHPSSGTIVKQTGWKKTDRVNVECIDGEYYSLCYNACVRPFKNATVETIDRECIPKLPLGLPLKVTMEKRYGVQSGQCSWRRTRWEAIRNSEQLAYWIDLSDKPDISRPHLIERAALTSLRRASNAWYAYFTDIDIYLNAIDSVEVNSDQDGGRRTYNDGFYAPFTFRAPEFYDAKFTGWDATWNRTPYLNVTQLIQHWADIGKEVPRFMMLRTPFLMPTATEAHIDAPFPWKPHGMNLALDITEGFWAIADTWCESFDTCDDCTNAKGCHWCLGPTYEFKCRDECVAPFSLKQCPTTNPAYVADWAHGTANKNLPNENRP